MSFRYSFILNGQLIKPYLKRKRHNGRSDLCVEQYISRPYWANVTWWNSWKRRITRERWRRGEKLQWANYMTAGSTFPNSLWLATWKASMRQFSGRVLHGYGDDRNPAETAGIPRKLREYRGMETGIAGLPREWENCCESTARIGKNYGIPAKTYPNITFVVDGLLYLHGLKQ